MFSYQRNRQPAFKGKSERVGNKGKNSFPELQYAREQVLEACKRAGSLFAHWRRYTPEFNLGPCPACTSGRLKQSVDPNCPVCFGTGFDGGYSKPTVQHMIVQHSDRRLEATSTGFVRLNRAKSQSPYLPNIAVSDVIGEIKNMDGEFITDDRYMVEAGVDKIRFRLADEFMAPDTYDHLDPESEVVSYDFESTRIPKTINEEDRNVKYAMPFENAVWLTNTIGTG